MGSHLDRKTVVVSLLITILLCSTVAATAQSSAVAGKKTTYIVFRDDDVAPRTKFAQLQAVNQVHIDKNVPVTLGITPHQNASKGNQLLQDKQFLNYMRSIALTRLFEFAQHGYTHQSVTTAISSEFYGRPYAVQYDTIKKGRDDITQAFGVVPTTFIPPFDKSDNNTLKAAKVLGFTEYSTSFRDFNILQGQRGSINIESVSLVFANDNLASLKNKTDRFINDPNNTNVFVVLYHPADFSSPNGVVNAERVKLLADYIDYLKGTGRVQFTTFDRLLTTEGLAHTSSSALIHTEKPAASTNDAGNITTGTGLNIEGIAPLPYITLGLIILIPIGIYGIIRRSRSKQ